MPLKNIFNSSTMCRIFLNDLFVMAQAFVCN
uniref:Uncharacterized protein n=1 Tax=Anguilla anguilla TaxID=7936 RepID=A0A0E9PAE6_ANGAN